MTLYLILEKIDSKSQGVLQPGSKSDLAWLKPGTIQGLLDRQTVRELKSPPLAAFRGWKSRAGRLKSIEIVTVADFLGGDYDQIARHMRVKPETVKKWAGQLTEWAGAGEDVNMILSKK